MKFSGGATKLAIDCGIGGLVMGVFLMDWLLAPPTLSLPFIYVILLPFSLKASRLRRESYRLGAVCALLTVSAAVLKMPAWEYVPAMAVNRFFALLAIGSMTYMVESTIGSEERDYLMEQRIARLEQHEIERRMIG